MLIVGDHTILEFIGNIENLKVYNLSSLKEGYERLDILPYRAVNYEDEKQFDIMYANFLLENDAKFVEFFKIIHNLYEGNHVLILIQKDDFYDMITESLIKFIQQRYGYIANYINVPEDLYDIEDKAEFSLTGLYNLDLDKERYTLLTFKGE